MCLVLDECSCIEVLVVNNQLSSPSFHVQVYCPIKTIRFIRVRNKNLLKIQPRWKWLVRHPEPTISYSWTLWCCYTGVHGAVSPGLCQRWYPAATTADGEVSLWRCVRDRTWFNAECWVCVVPPYMKKTFWQFTCGGGSVKKRKRAK